MTTIVHNCPRCGANKMTFDVIADVYRGTKHEWQHLYEICAVCRRCGSPSLMKIQLAESRYKNHFGKKGAVSGMPGDVEPTFRFAGFIDLADAQAKPAPADLPADIDQAFVEGARCLAIGCPNAAAAMFRLCLDLATKELLPPDEQPEPNRHQRRNLAPRLAWLFDSKILQGDLRALSGAVKENGDDGAHDGNLDSHDAEDIYDFAFALLERLYTQPARLAAASKRKEERRARRDGVITREGT